MDNEYIMVDSKGMQLCVGLEFMDDIVSVNLAPWDTLPGNLSQIPGAMTNVRTN